MKSGRIWDEDHGLLDETQIKQCRRADSAELLRSPIPTRMVSNGEYMPIAQTDQQKQVETRLEKLADSASKKLGVTRRQFLASSGGMAAALLAMNEVFGRIFKVSPIEMFEPAAFAQASVPRDVFVFDDQLHIVRGSRPSPQGLRARSQGPSFPAFDGTSLNPEGQLDELGSTWSVWNPELVGMPFDPRYAHITQFIKEAYLDSQITIRPAEQRDGVHGVDRGATATAAERAGSAGRRNLDRRADGGGTELR